MRSSYTQLGIVNASYLCVGARTVSTLAHTKRHAHDNKNANKITNTQCSTVAGWALCTVKRVHTGRETQSTQLALRLFVHTTRIPNACFLYMFRVIVFVVALVHRISLGRLLFALCPRCCVYFASFSILWDLSTTQLMYSISYWETLNRESNSFIEALALSAQSATYQFQLVQRTHSIIHGLRFFPFRRHLDGVVAFSFRSHFSIYSCL